MDGDGNVSKIRHESHLQVRSPWREIHNSLEKVPPLFNLHFHTETHFVDAKTPPRPPNPDTPCRKEGKKEEKQLWNLFAIRHIFEAFSCRSNNQDFFSPLKSRPTPQAPLP